MCLQQYLLEDVGGYESTAGVEGPSATNVEVSLVERLQNSQEISTLQLDRHSEKDSNGKICHGGWQCFVRLFCLRLRSRLFQINFLNFYHKETSEKSNNKRI